MFRCSIGARLFKICSYCKLYSDLKAKKEGVFRGLIWTIPRATTHHTNQPLEESLSTSSFLCRVPCWHFLQIPTDLPFLPTSLFTSVHFSLPSHKPGEKPALIFVVYVDDHSQAQVWPQRPSSRILQNGIRLSSRVEAPVLWKLGQIFMPEKGRTSRIM
jgi:hypothetical protein